LSAEGSILRQHFDAVTDLRQIYANYLTFELLALTSTQYAFICGSPSLPGVWLLDVNEILRVADEGKSSPPARFYLLANGSPGINPGSTAAPSRIKCGTIYDPPA
jgi:hypothetical protein